MTETIISLIVFMFAAGGLWLGRGLAHRLPKEHLEGDARTSAQIGIGMLATLAAMVLGLMITSAKDTFDVRRVEIIEAASSIALLDRALGGYGPEARPARAELAGIYERIAQRVGASGNLTVDEFDMPLHNIGVLTHLQATILEMKPTTDAQRWFQARAMTLTTDLAKERILTLERGDHSIPPTVIVIVVLWVFLIFMGVGVFAVNNRTVNTTLVMCALAFAGSIFLILELDTPYSGFIGVSSQPLRNVADVLGK